MLEPSSEDTSHLFMLLFPQISLSGLKSPLGWALIDSKASRGCSRNPQDQAGSREGNTRALWVTAPSRGGFPKLRQDWECPNRTSPGQGRAGPGTQGCGGRKGRRNISNRVATPDSLLLLQTPQQCCDTCRNPLLVHLSIHPSLPPSGPLKSVCRHGNVNQWTAGSHSLQNILTLTSIPLGDTALPKFLNFHRGSHQPLLSLNFNPFTNAWRAELLELNLCFIWTQQL